MTHAKQKNMDTSKHAPLGSESREFRCPDSGELLLKIDRVRFELLIPPPRNQCPWFVITEEIFKEAKALVPLIQLQNDRANEFDALTGTIGELVFAEWLFGDFHKHAVGSNFGDSDFKGIEIKTSLTALTRRKHLIAKANYVEARPTDFYVQCFIHSTTPKRGPLVGDTVFLAGWLDKDQLLQSGKEHLEVTREGLETGIRTIRVPLPDLNPMQDFRRAYEGHLNGEAE